MPRARAPQNSEARDAVIVCAATLLYLLGLNWLLLSRMAIAVAAALVVGALPLPAAWQGARLVRRPRRDTVPLR